MEIQYLFTGYMDFRERLESLIKQALVGTVTGNK